MQTSAHISITCPHNLLTGKLEMPLITHAARMVDIVARSGSVRKASELVNSASSAVNRQILNLEAEYDAPLFTRHPRGMRLTEAGEMVAETVRRWQAEDQQLREEIQVLRGRAGHIRIGIMECLAASYLPSLHTKIQAAGEMVALEVKVGGTNDLARQLKTGDLDLAITFNMPSEFGFKALYEAKMELGAVMRPDHELANLNPVPREALNQFPLILADQSLTIAPVVQSMLVQSRMSTEAIAKSNSVTVIKSLLKQGDCVSFLTLADVFKEVMSGELHFIPVERMHSHEVLSICAADERQMTPVAHLVSRLASDQMESIRSDFLSKIRKK